MKKIIATIIMTALFSATAFSVELLKADFSGTPNAAVSSIPAADAQITVHGDVENKALDVIGGTTGTTNWQYNATGDALLNEDLFTSSVYGQPTRMDLGLALASLGKTYTITNIEVDVVVANATDVSMDLWFARDEDADVKVHAPSVIIPAGNTGTFAIDTTLAHLIATDSGATWNQSKAANGDLRLGFFATDGSNVDSIEIAEVRVNGTVGDYVAPVAETNTSWSFNTPGDTEGWSQDVNAHIDGLDVLSAFSGTEKVLSANAITGNDPQVVNYGPFAPAAGYWVSAIIRVRQLDTGGTPLSWDGSGCAVVLGDTIVSFAIGGAGWEVTTGAGEWITASIDISELGTNTLDYVRFDPVGQASATNKLFEIDYIFLTSTASPPPPDNTFWEFNVDGDLEGWVQAGNDHIVGLDATNGMLSSQSISGDDPQLYGPAVSPSTWYWTTVEVRARQLTSGGTPLDWDFSGCDVRINGNLQVALGNPAAWDVDENEVSKWIVATLDISQFDSDNIYELRIDPVGSAAGTNKNFEIDYIRLNKAPVVPPPAAPQFAWEFDTLGDTEGWVGNAAITDLDVTNGLDGVVLASQAITDNDPQLNTSSLGLSPATYAWHEAEIRLRHLTNGVPETFDLAGTIFIINGKSLTWDYTTEGAGEWIVATFNIAQLRSDTINSMRLDPIGSAAGVGKNFEVDYIRLSTTVPGTKILIDSWEFNTGSVGDFTGVNITGLMATDAVSGSEKVLTSSDLTSNDAQVQLPFDAAISPNGVWDTLEFRFRQLDANPPGGTSQVYTNTGTILIINNAQANSSNLGEIKDSDPDYTVTVESDGWISVVADISYLAGLNLTNFRLDPIGGPGSDVKNFEIDWIRVYALQPTVGYDAWTFQNGLSGDLALSSTDADLDTFDNFYEYAFDGNPIDPDDIGLSHAGSVVNVGSNVLEYISYQRSDPDSGVDYSLVASPNLVLTGFSELTEGTDYTVAGTGTYDDDMDAVTNHIPTDLNVEFIRTRAE